MAHTQGLLMSSMLLFIIALIIVGVILSRFIFTRSPPSSNIALEEGFSSKRDRTVGYDFYIYNYLTNHTIRVEIAENDSENTPFVLADGVAPGERYGITKDQSLKAFTEGGLVKVYTRRVTAEGESTEDWELYTTLRINIDGIKSLRIGMVTTLWKAGDPGHTVQQAGSGGVQGMPHIRIHNLAEVPLSLNYNIRIPPKETLHYRGEHALGVRLGLILKDNNGMYPTTQINKPVTDLYYGVISDIAQGLYGGLSYTPHGIGTNDIQWDDADVSASGIYLLEDGWY